jgi:hypothetical protein
MSISSIFGPNHVYPQKIHNLRTDKSYEPVKKTIYIVSKVAQAFFAAGVLFSINSAFLAAAPLISGGSFMYYGSLAAFHSIEAIICFDALKLSSNIAAIFKTDVISRYATQKFGSSAGKATKALENYFDGPDLDPKKKLSAQELAHKAVKGTLLLNQGEVFILEFLKAPK